MTDLDILNVRRDIIAWIASWLCPHCLETLKKKEERT